MSVRNENIKIGMTLHERIQLFLLALNGDDFPSDGLCHHLGTGFRQGMFYVSIADNGSRMLLMIYNQQLKKFSSKVFDHIRAEVTKIAPIIGEWNGMHGASGISLIIAKPVPRALLVAITNYNRLTDVFSRRKEQEARFTKFDNWERQQLQLVGWEDMDGEI